LGWLEAFGLALANWVYDAATLVVCLFALGTGVPWRGILVAYSLTQIAASIPITPGGLGVVEGSLAALLVAYGLPPGEALTATFLYRLVSFWGLVPIGWATWVGLELAQRQGVRRKVHPWAVHRHGAVPSQAAFAQKGPDRVFKPARCEGCDELGRPELRDEKVAA
jgi:hypothetical protein